MKKNRNGFTLIELLVVITIIGIIAAMAIPKLMTAVTKANEAKTYSALNAYRKTLGMYMAYYGEYHEALNQVTDKDLMATNITTVPELVGTGPLPGDWVCDWTRDEWEAAGWIQSEDAQGGWNYCKNEGIVWIDEDDKSLMNKKTYDKW